MFHFTSLMQLPENSKITNVNNMRNKYDSIIIFRGINKNHHHYRDNISIKHLQARHWDKPMSSIV